MKNKNEKNEYKIAATGFVVKTLNTTVEFNLPSPYTDDIYYVYSGSIYNSSTSAVNLLIQIKNFGSGKTNIEIPASMFLKVKNLNLQSLQLPASGTSIYLAFIQFTVPIEKDILPEIELKS
jgi:hypothetical protein